MKYLTAGEASKIAGVSKPTICRALKSGKLSYVSIDSDGYKIDPAELSRVYDLKHNETPQGVTMLRSVTPDVTPNETPNQDNGNELIKYKLQVMEEKIEEFKKREEGWERERTRLEHQIDAWMKQAEAKTRLLEAPQENPITTTQAHEEPKKTEQEQLYQETIPMEEVSKVYPSTQIMPNNIVENSSFLDESKTRPRFDINKFLLA